MPDLNSIPHASTPPPPRGPTDAIAELIETHRQRAQLQRAQTSLTLQIKAMARRIAKSKTPEEKRLAERVAAFASLPLQNARKAIHAEMLYPDRRMRQLAKELPVYEWMLAVPGFGDLGLAQIVAEAGGPLTNYANPAKLWKRFGLAVMPDGRQRRVSGAAAIEHGYSPQRRSIMFVIGDSLIKKAGPYRDLYLERKVFYRAKWPDDSDMHVHRAAQRYMEKRLLRDLWRAWRDAA